MNNKNTFFKQRMFKTETARNARYFVLMIVINAIFSQIATASELVYPETILARQSEPSRTVSIVAGRYEHLGGLMREDGAILPKNPDDVTYSYRDNDTLKTQFSPGSFLTWKCNSLKNSCTSSVDSTCNDEDGIKKPDMLAIFESLDETEQRKIRRHHDSLMKVLNGRSLEHVVIDIKRCGSYNFYLLKPSERAAARPSTSPPSPRRPIILP